MRECKASLILKLIQHPPTTRKSIPMISAEELRVPALGVPDTETLGYATRVSVISSFCQTGNAHNHLNKDPYHDDANPWEQYTTSS